MEETKDPDAHASVGTEDKSSATPRRDAEATSSETLGDIEESEKVSSGSAEGSSSSPLEGSSPSPDAGGGGGRADGGDTGGPM
jgi:hypothetical protein